MDEVKVETKWDRHDYVRAIRRGYRLSVSDIVIVGACGLAGYGIHEFLLTAAVGMVGALAIDYVILPNRVWKVGLGLGETRSMIFSESGLRVISQSMTLNVPWSRIVRSRETANFYYLYTKMSPMPSPIRKSSFTNSQDEDHFRSMLTEQTKYSG
jgi:hypothetical protein